MWYRREYFPVSRPRAAKGGIRSQSKRGSFGETWWAKRWIAVLESFNLGARLTRGRSYARSGQVLSIDIDKGAITSRVQGSRATPYAVTIKMNTLTNAEWHKLAETLAGQARFAAKLVAGEMPQDIEQVFTSASLSLFPSKLRDLQTECSCPDWSNPCKHIAAVYYLLGEEFDRDPFLIFKLRGLTRTEFLELLGKVGGAAAAEGSTRRAELPALPAEPLPTEPRTFWQGGELPANLFGDVTPPPVSAALPRRLGHFPFWRGKELLLDVLERVYEEASGRGRAVVYGEAARVS